MREVKSKAVYWVLLCAMMVMGTGAMAASIVWPQQDAKNWDALDAIWETSPGTPSPVPPGSGDYAYVLSSNPVTVDSTVNVKRLYIDRAYSGYTAVASTITVAPGGVLEVNSICNPGQGVAGGTLHIAGGEMILSALDRDGAYSLYVDDNYASVLSITAGTLSVRNNSYFLIYTNSQADVTVSGTGTIEFRDGSGFDIRSGALGVKISDTGLIKYVGADATAEIQSLASAGLLTGISPVSPAPFVPTGTSNGVGWYYDGTDTYAFAIAGPQVEIGGDLTVWLADAQAGIQLTSEILNYDAGQTYNYNWSGDGVSFSPSDTVADPVATISSAGTYSINLQVTNSNGIGADMITVNVLDAAILNKQIAHWAMDEGSGTAVTDSSVDGYTNNGAIAGTVDWREGWAGSNSLYFDGLTTVDVAPDTSMDPNLYPNLNTMQYGITLAAWVKADVEGQTQYILEKPGSYFLRLLPTSGGFRTRFYGLSNQYLDSESGVNMRFDNGNWYHVAATYDAVAQEAKMYVNGFLVQSQPTSGLLTTGDPNLVLGESLTGGLDDVYVYSYALSESQVQALAAMGEKVSLVEAGPDQVYQINPSLPLILQGSVEDLDSSPIVEWSVSPDSVGSAASVTFDDTSDPTTAVYFNPTDPNEFTLRLTATDTVGGEAVVIYDEVVITTNAPTCADVIAAGLVLPLDLSGPVEGQPDCYIDLHDFAYLAQHWLRCNDPENTACEWPWQ